MNERYTVVATLTASEKERLNVVTQHLKQKLDVTHMSATSIFRAALLALEEKEGLVAERYTDAI